METPAIPINHDEPQTALKRNVENINFKELRTVGKDELASKISDLDSDSAKVIFLLKSWTSSLYTEGDDENNHTWLSYTKTAHDFIDYVGGMDKVLKVKPTDVSDFITTQVYKPSSQSVKLAAIREMYRQFMINDLISVNPATNVKVSGHNYQPVHSQAPSMQVIKDGLEKLNAQKDPVKKARDRAIILLLLNNALRRFECAGIKLKDIADDEDDGKIIHIQGKGKSNKKIFLNPVTAKAIDDWLEVRTADCEYLFVSYRYKIQYNKRIPDDSLRDLTLKYFGEGVTPHCLRAASITEVYRASDLLMAQRHARHCQSSTTEIYLDAVKAKESVKYQPTFS